MKYITNTPIIIKDSSELTEPYIFMYNQVFVQTQKIKTCYTSRNISCLYWTE